MNRFWTPKNAIGLCLGITAGIGLFGGTVVSAKPDYSKGDFADGLSGGPDYYQVFKVPSGDRLNFRNNPSTRGKVLMRLSNGTVLQNLGAKIAGGQRWCHVKTTGNNPKIGWVSGRYLRESTVVPPR